MLKIRDTKILLTLALPLIASGLVESSVGFSSTLFLSHLGPELLAAGSLVAWFYATVLIIFWGVFSSVSVLVANFRGANNHDGIAKVIRDAFWTAIALTLPISIMIWNMAPILHHVLGQRENLVLLAVPYLHALAWSMLPDFTGILLMQIVIGLGHVRTNLIFSLTWVILNITADYVFIFGHLGFPAFGIAGLGWGTTFSFWVTTIAWFIYMFARKIYRPYFSQLFRFRLPFYYWKILKIGLPMGLMWCVEVTFFFVMSLLIGHMSVTALAASQIGMQYTSLFVSILFAISQAISVRVSHLIGSQKTDAIHNTLESGLLISLCIIAALVLAAWINPMFFIEADFNPYAYKALTVVLYAKQFLRIGLTFLLLESVRITLFGALRGMQDTRSPLLSSLIGFWLIAIPLGYFLAYFLNYGAIGFWLGLYGCGLFGSAFLWQRYKVRYQALLTK